MVDNDRALLELSHVDTFYGPIHALRDISLRIEQGHITCLLGGNASGKSTTLKTILGMADAVNGIMLAATDPKAINETFNIGSGESITVGDLAKVIVDMSGLDLTPMYKSFGNGIRTAKREIYTRLPDTTKAKSLLGFDCQISVVEGLRSCYESYLARAASPSNQQTMSLPSSSGPQTSTPDSKSAANRPGPVIAARARRPRDTTTRTKRLPK